jgi:Arc/MetJ-type ribon-helix-helix transcriptional regulator
MGITIRLDVVIEVQKFPESDEDLWIEVMEIPGGYFCPSSDQANKFRSPYFFDAKIFDKSDIPNNSVKIEKLRKEFDKISGFCLTLEEMKKIDWDEEVKEDGKWKEYSGNIRKALNFYEEKEDERKKYYPNEEELEDLKEGKVLEKEDSIIVAERKTRNDFKPVYWGLAEVFMRDTIEYINDGKPKEEYKIGEENIRMLFIFPSGRRRAQESSENYKAKIGSKFKDYIRKIVP